MPPHEPSRRGEDADRHPNDLPAIDAIGVDASRVVVSDDRDSNTPMVFLNVRGEPGDAGSMDDHRLLRTDRGRTRVITLQIEGVLAAFVWRENRTRPI